MTRGHIYNLKVPTSVGPWSDKTKQHPGLIVAHTAGREGVCVIVPLTSSKPRGVSGKYCVELEEVTGSIDPPIWIRCDCLATIAANGVPQQQRRAILPGGVMRKVTDRIGALLEISPF